MSRLWEGAAAGAALQVRLVEGSPGALRWQGAWRRVEHIALRWQVDLRWWGARVYRDYYKLLAGGMALVIYHDLLSDGWALERVYD